MADPLYLTNPKKGPIGNPYNKSPSNVSVASLPTENGPGDVFNPSTLNPAPISVEDLDTISNNPSIVLNKEINLLQTDSEPILSPEPDKPHLKTAFTALAVIVLLLGVGMFAFINHKANEQSRKLSEAERRWQQAQQGDRVSQSNFGDLRATTVVVEETIEAGGDINTNGAYRVQGMQIASSNLSDASNIAYLDSTQIFDGANTFSNPNNTFVGDGSGLTGITATTRLPGSVTVQGNAFNGASQLVQLTAGGVLPVLSGVKLTNLNASNISSGTIANARLSANVAFRNVANNFTKSQTISASGGKTTLALTSTGPNTGLTLGGDTNLYRSAANTLKTDDNFHIQTASNSTTAFQVQNTIGNSLFNVDTTDNNITIGSGVSADLPAWQTNADSLPAARQDAVTVNYNGYAYVIGGSEDGSTGSTCGTPTDTVYYAPLNGDGSTGSWSTTTSLPVARCEAMGVTADGYIYVIGGTADDANDTNTVYYAQPDPDGTISSWSTNAESLPNNKGGGTVVAYSGYIYVVDGEDGWNTSGNGEMYYAQLNGDGSTGSWSTQSLPRQFLWGTANVSSGYIYMVGGYDEPDIVYYAPLNGDGSVGTWDTTTSLPINLYSTTSVVSNGYLYVLGGSNPSYLNPAVTDVYYAAINGNGSLGNWNLSSNPMPTAQEFAGSFVNDGYVYEIGGESDGNGGTVRSTVYYSELPTNPSETTVLVLDAKSISGDPTGLNGGMYYNSNIGKFRCYEDNSWVDCIGSGGSVNNLQDAYDGGSTILTTDGNDINITLADASTDPNFIIDIAAGSTGEFKIQSDGTDILHMGSAGQLQLDVQGSGGGILLGGDTNLYRSNTNVLATDDTFQTSAVTSILDLTLSGADHGTGTTGGKITLDHGQNSYPGGDVVINGGSTSPFYSSQPGAEITVQGASYADGSSIILKLGLQYGGSSQSFQVTDNSSNILQKISSSGAVTFQNSSDSTAAFQIQNADGSTLLLNADTTNSVITIAGTTGTFATLTLDNAHFKSTQTNAPTIGTPSNCGATPTAAVQTNSTDSAGSFRITAGTGSPTTCDTVITFNKAYGAAPKSILVVAETKDGGTGTAAARQIYVSGSATTTFTVKFNASPAASEVNWFYYWVIE